MLGSYLIPRSICSLIPKPKLPTDREIRDGAGSGDGHTGVGEVSLDELVLLDLETTVKNLEGLLTTDGAGNGDLFITTNGEGTDGETS